MSFRVPAKVRRLFLGLGTTVAAALCIVPAASADFTVAQCGGDGVFGRGASFQTNAVTGFIDIFNNNPPEGCGATTPFVGYDPAGSGAGRRALGERGTNNPSQDRDPSIRFAGSDEPPTPPQRQQIEKGPIDANGQDVTAADDGKLHVIPVAIGAITIMVHLPDGCDYSGATHFRERPTIDNETLEAIFAGDPDFDTWGEAISGLNAPCQSEPIKRIVRQDPSGTTFALKQLLANINPTRGWASLDNVDWPNPTTVARPTLAGGSAVRNLLAHATDGEGGIGYADLATARGGGAVFTHEDANDRMFWLSLQRRETTTYDDPQAAELGYETGNTARGANCESADVNPLPANSFSDWSQVDSTYSADEYNGCTLTYDLVFDDNSTVYCNSIAEERKARTIKDYLELAVVSDAGQNGLLASDYDRLPGDVLAKARSAVAQIGWKKGTDGRPCTPTGGGNNPPPPPPGGGGGTTPPPPPPISNAFSITNARVQNRRSIRVSLQFPGAGQLMVRGSAKPRRGKAINLSRRTVAVPAAGTQRVTVALNSKMRRALNRTRRLTVTLRLTYTPNGGTARTVSRRVTVRAPSRSRS
jgi:ABC-type phosphate transport system substrate-binding protein